ncbi:type III secretion system stator protein SctL [Burkholderia ubonensis]|uniref:type III secretion system stator protein SctL n=1 Tax=Burkholderia ubonensis TaxID=101571 RepID=UPI0009B4BE9D|nr:type III secretion system stator protein SctL [Burkholderia ubonensis]
MVEGVGMGIWLRRAGAAPGGSGPDIGTDSDVIRRDALGVLLELDAACVQVQEDRAKILDQARNEAAGIVTEAEVRASEICAEAQKRYDEAEEQGYREGRQRALSEWMERLADAGDLRRRVQLGMRERLAEIVTLAVEQIVNSESSRALFVRALGKVERIIDGDSRLRVAVHPEDHADAQKIFGVLATRWRKSGRSFPLHVVKDKRLARGSCICESDSVIVDAGVGSQLRAMRSAAKRALNQSALEVIENASDGDES